MTREEAIKILDCYDIGFYDLSGEKIPADKLVEAFDMAIEALSAEAKPTMTEEVREALMRLTMCAREECGMCKYKDDCGFEFQYNISTENMHTILDAFQADNISPSLSDVYKWERDIALSQLEEYGIGFAEKKRDDVVEVVRCKNCDKYYICPYISIHSKQGGYCSFGKRKEKEDGR